MNTEAINKILSNRIQCLIKKIIYQDQFDEEFLETKEQLQKLQDGNHLLFQQVPMVEIDGMKLVQTRSILHYIAEKHHLFGRDLKERTLIDMYVEGTLDLLELLIMHPFLKPDDQHKEVVSMAQKAIIRYFPVFEKVLRDHGQRFLVGNQLSLADVILLQTILALEEKIPNILSAFPHLQEFSVKISNVPTIKKFLEPGSKKKPPADDIYGSRLDGWRLITCGLSGVDVTYFQGFDRETLIHLSSLLQHCQENTSDIALPILKQHF